MLNEQEATFFICMPSRMGGFFSFVHLDSSGADGAKTACNVEPINTTPAPLGELIYLLHIIIHFYKCQKSITRNKTLSHNPCLDFNSRKLGHYVLFQ